jgi:Protein of unknown function (DUF3467)
MSDNIKAEFANFARFSTTPDEMMVELGVQVAGQTAESPSTFDVRQRVIFGWIMAKRLANALTDSVRQYESVYGVLEIDSGKRRETEETRRQTAITELQKKRDTAMPQRDGMHRDMGNQ